MPRTAPSLKTPTSRDGFFEQPRKRGANRLVSSRTLSDTVTWPTLLFHSMDHVEDFRHELDGYQTDPCAIDATSSDHNGLSSEHNGPSPSTTAPLMAQREPAALEAIAAPLQRKAPRVILLTNRPTQAWSLAARAETRAGAARDERRERGSTQGRIPALSLRAPRSARAAASAGVSCARPAARRASGTTRC